MNQKTTPINDPDALRTADGAPMPAGESIVFDPPMSTGELAPGYADAVAAELGVQASDVERAFDDMMRRA